MFKINKRRQILLKARIYFHTRLGRIRTHKKREEMAMKYRIIDGEITDPKDVWGIGEIRNPKRYICLPSNNNRDQIEHKRT